MIRQDIESNVKEIIKSIKPLDEIDFVESLFNDINNFESRDMVVVMMKIKEVFGVDLNSLITSLHDYSCISIIESVEKQLNYDTTIRR